MIIKLPENLFVRIILWFFEQSYYHLKAQNLFTNFEILNIENAIFNIKKENSL